MNGPPGNAWHHLDSQKVLELLESDQSSGLNAIEAMRRSERFGLNLIPSVASKNALQRFLVQFHQPLVYILIVAGCVTLWLGQTVDASVIFGVVLVNAVVGYIQEAKAVSALDALSRSMVTQAMAMRAGQPVSIASRELVPGDIVLLRSGDKTPADLRLLSTKELLVDESALTGESLPAIKDAMSIAEEAILAERTNMAYASTLVMQGQGTGVVVATGLGSEIGRISTMVQQADELATPLTLKISAFSRVLLWGILGLAGLTFTVGILRGENASSMFIAAVALAVGAIPEGLPAAVTVILAMGVSRMATRKAVIRKLPAVETLGGTTVICTDKTGTLTMNQMTVTEIWSAGALHHLSGTGLAFQGRIEPEPGPAVTACLRAGLLCNDSHVVKGPDGSSVAGDPTEAALVVSAAKGGVFRDKENSAHARLDCLPFEPRHQYMATLHDQGPGRARLIIIKGAVEVLLAISHEMLGPDGGALPLDATAVHTAAGGMGGRGLRVLAMGSKEMPAHASSISREDVAGGVVLLGLQGMIDPPRPEAMAAVAACFRAGIQVKMITGDHATTAAAIGRQLHLEGCEDGGAGRPDTVTGVELASLNDGELKRRVAATNIFARVSPEQKLRLVQAMQSLGEIVAMTGDGVNDAPALKQADIGVAMGLTGTDAAKEAADMILTDDNFATIEAAVEEGRGVFDNLLKFIVWTLPTNMGEGLVILMAVLFGLPLPILPVQILWINMTTAGCLGIMLAFEPKEPGIMERPPRKPSTPLLPRPLVMRIALVSGLLLAFAFALFEWEMAVHGDVFKARTVAVNVFVMIEALYLLNCRSLSRSAFASGFRGNPYVLAGIGVMIMLQMAYTYLPAMNRLFSSAPLGIWPWVKIVVASISAFSLVEWLKYRQDRWW